jgi:hypothetical protein
LCNLPDTDFSGKNDTYLGMCFCIIYFPIVGLRNKECPQLHLPGNISQSSDQQRVIIFTQGFLDLNLANALLSRH